MSVTRTRHSPLDGPIELAKVDGWGGEAIAELDSYLEECRDQDPPATALVLVVGPGGARALNRGRLRPRPVCASCAERPDHYLNVRVSVTNDDNLGLLQLALLRLKEALNRNPIDSFPADLMTELQRVIGLGRDQLNELQIRSACYPIWQYLDGLRPRRFFGVLLDDATIPLAIELVDMSIKLLEGTRAALVITDMFPESGSESRLVVLVKQRGGLVLPLGTLDENDLTLLATHILAHAKFTVDLHLMSSVKNVNEIPTAGKDRIIVAAVGNVLHFRMFESDGTMVVDTDENRLTEQARQIQELRTRLVVLWPPHELTGSEKDDLITTVTSIVGHKPHPPSPFGDRALLAALRRRSAP